MSERLTQQQREALDALDRLQSCLVETWAQYDAVRLYILNSTPAQEPYEIGTAGSAYDLPGKRRAYTYQEQPDNVGACRLGYAATQARSASGDAVDVGLALLRSLEERGFGVFELAAPTPEDTSHGQP